MLLNTIAVTGALLFSAGPLHSITVSGFPPDSIGYLAPAGATANCLWRKLANTDCLHARLSSLKSRGRQRAVGCYGPLLADGMSILAADGSAPAAKARYDFVEGALLGRIGRLVFAIVETDNDDRIESRSGECAGDASVTYNAALLRSAMANLPEPKTMFLVGTALVALSLLGNKRREP